MAQRSKRQRRKARRAASPSADPVPAPPSQPSAEPELSRGEVARAELRPLGPDERPGAIVIASIVAVLLGAANLGLGIAAGAPLRDLVPALVLMALMGATAYGTWNRRYWGVLTMQAVLGISIVLFALFLIRAPSLTATLPFIALILLFGWIFWKLVGVMARIQMPERPAR